MRAFVRDNGVALVFGALFLARTAEFWEDTLQNWQSEFLAVGAISIFSVFLRARHSAESKRVGAPHAETGTS